MDKEMRKWEKELEKWENGEYESKIRSLDSQANGKSVERENLNPRNESEIEDTINIKRRYITKEDFKELNRLKAIRKIIPQVKNILELRNNLENEIKDIKEEQARRGGLKTLNGEIDKLEIENANLMLEAEKLNLKLKDQNLTDEEKTKIYEELEKNKENRRINNEKFRENQINMKNGAMPKKELQEKSDEELEKMSVELSTKVSKCNMACNNLMQGKSWNEIEMKLDKWDKKEEKFIGKKEDSEKMTKVTPIGEERKAEEEKEDVLPVEYKSFAERHPILGKIPFLAKIMDRIEKKRIPDNTIKIDQELEKLEKERGKEVRNILEEKRKDKEIQKEDDFKKYLREVAEKGLKGIDKEKSEKIAEEEQRKKEEKEARMAMKKEQLRESKKNIADELAKKYGGRYGEQDGAQIEKEDEGKEPGE